MAKINVEFDTVEKTMAVSMDGTPMPNVAGVTMFLNYGDDDEYCCELVQVSKDEAHDTRVVTRTCASNQNGATSLPDSTIPGFKVKEQTSGRNLSKVSANIAAYFSKAKR